MNAPKVLAGLVAGLLFGAGLAVSGMTNPSKVLNFLDVTSSWDPSLALVMASAIPVATLTFLIAKRRTKPVFEPRFVLPETTRLDGKLVLGSALFGIGWGLAGYCPGPALASLSTPDVQLLAFLAAMTVGLMASDRLAKMVSQSRPQSPARQQKESHR